MSKTVVMPELGPISEEAGFRLLTRSSDGRFAVGEGDVQAIATTGDGKVEFIAFAHHTLACVLSAMGYPAYYPVHPVELRKPIKAVLMDLDGTSVRSEGFWVWIIQKTVATLLGNPRFEFTEADLPYVSGHSVSEHLQYAIGKYCPGKAVEDARRIYFEHTHREMQEIMAGRGRVDAFVPSPGLKDFLLAVKGAGVKIGLVTSGLYEKAYPEIVAALRTLGMGDPAAFYDAIITAGFPLRKGEIGTLGELSAKPHPWLYAEVCRVGLGIPFEERQSVVGIEDSGAGVCAIRLAGFPVIGMAGGNIVESGTRALCYAYCRDFDEVRRIVL